MMASHYGGRSKIRNIFHSWSHPRGLDCRVVPGQVMPVILMFGAFVRTAVFLVFFAATLGCPSALAVDLEEFGRRMTYFYLAPSRESFDKFQKTADQFRDKLEGSRNRADILAAVMIAKISQTHNWPIGDGVFGKKAKEIAEGKSRLARYVIDDLQVDPLKLDVWWVGFSATGDERFLENIFQYAGHELPKDDIRRMLLVGAATWSFKANCRQHRKVLEFARRKLLAPSISDAQVKFVKECIAFAEANSAGRSAPMPNRPDPIDPEPPLSQ